MEGTIRIGRRLARWALAIVQTLVSSVVDGNECAPGSKVFREERSEGRFLLPTGDRMPCPDQRTVRRRIEVSEVFVSKRPQLDECADQMRFGVEVRTHH